ncbi:MAG: DUF2268 domain-containing putative Zn-dependent protease [Pseudomonadota bacterium]
MISNASLPKISLHFLSARGQLDRYEKRVRETVSNVVKATTALEKLGPLDIIVQEGRWVIPQIGHTGYTPKADAIFLTLDTKSEALEANLGLPMERVLAHEFHHARRWDTVGCGKTLGEQLITEGLAGRFVEEIYDNPPEPWESAVSLEKLRPHLGAAAQEWDSENYDHMRWFFGEGDLPHWIGYSLGYQLVGKYLEVNSDSRPSMLAAAPAASFRTMLDCLAKE